MTYFVSVGRKTLLNQLQVIAGAGSAWLLDGRSFSAQERRARQYEHDVTTDINDADSLCRPPAGWPTRRHVRQSAGCLRMLGD